MYIIRKIPTKGNTRGVQQKLALNRSIKRQKVSGSRCPIVSYYHSERIRLMGSRPRGQFCFGFGNIDTQRAELWSKRINLRPERADLGTEGGVFEPSVVACALVAQHWASLFKKGWNPQYAMEL